MTTRRTYPLRQTVNTVLLLALLCGLAFVSGCTPAEDKQPQYAFTAEVRGLTDKTIRVTVIDSGTSELKEGLGLTLSTATYSDSSLEDISIGNLVTVVMTDLIEDTAQPVIPFSIQREKQPQYAFTAEVKAMTDETMRVTVTDPFTSELEKGQTLTLSTKTYSESWLEDVWVGNLVVVVMADPIGDISQLVVPHSIRREYTQPR